MTTEHPKRCDVSVVYTPEFEHLAGKKHVHYLISKQSAVIMCVCDVLKSLQEHKVVNTEPSPLGRIQEYGPAILWSQPKVNTQPCVVCVSV